MNMVRLYLLLIFNILRYAVNKLLYGARYNSRLIERMSLCASVRLFGKGKIDIGYNIELSPSVDIQVHGDGSLSIGDRVYMNRGCMVSCHGQVSIGEGCMFGPGVKIFDNNHRFESRCGVTTDLKIGTVTVGRNCWLASDVILLKGAQIGDNCVIGAGCIINSIVPPNSIVRNVQKQTITSIR